MKSLAAFLTVSFAALVTSDVQAQCTLDMDQTQCQVAVEGVLRSQGFDISAETDEQLKEVVIRDSRDLLKRFNTGLSSALSGGELTTFEDFIPRFNLFATGGDGDDAEAIVIEFNDFLNLPIDDGYRLTLQLRQPEPFQPLLAAIPEADRANLTDMFERELNDFDDAQLAFTYSPMSESIGRSDHQFFGEFFSAALVEAQSDMDEIASSLSDTADQRYAYTLEQIENVLYGDEEELTSFFIQATELSKSSGGICGDAMTAAVQQALRDDNYVSLTGTELTCVLLGAKAARQDEGQVEEHQQATLDLTVEGKLVQDYLNAFAEQTSAEFAAMRAEVSALENSNFYRIVDLINNQPQFIVRVDWRNRAALAGQDEFNAKLSYEHGFVNMNGLRKFCSGDSKAACLTNYLKDERRSKSLERGDRLSFSLQYSKKQSYDYTIDSTMTTLNLPSEESLMASLGFGRYVRMPSDDLGQTRFDLSASYEDVDGDTLRQDRLFATATFSQQITEGAALSLSFVYSNKPEFRGDVGTELSARLGVNYKLFNSRTTN